MVSQEDVIQQERLLTAYRSTLVIYQEQLAQLGFAFAPPNVRNGIEEARKPIRKIKNNLRQQGVEVEDFFIDDDIQKSDLLLSNPYYMRDLLLIDDIWDLSKILHRGDSDCGRFSHVC